MWNQVKRWNLTLLVGFISSIIFLISVQCLIQRAEADVVLAKHKGYVVTNKYVDIPDSAISVTVILTPPHEFISFDESHGDEISLIYSGCKFSTRKFWSITQLTSIVNNSNVEFAKEATDGFFVEEPQLAIFISLDHGNEIKFFFGRSYEDQKYIRGMFYPTSSQIPEAPDIYEIAQNMDSARITKKFVIGNKSLIKDVIDWVSYTNNIGFNGPEEIRIKCNDLINHLH